jgi:hypothetical protein
MLPEYGTRGKAMANTNTENDATGNGVAKAKKELTPRQAYLLAEEVKAEAEADRLFGAKPTRVSKMTEPTLANRPPYMSRGTMAEGANKAGQLARYYTRVAARFTTWERLQVEADKLGVAK